MLIYFKTIIVIFYIFYTNVVTAHVISVKNTHLYIIDKNFPRLTHEEKKTISKDISVVQTILNNYLNKLTINLLIDKLGNNVSKSNGNNYDCIINLSYKNKDIPILFTTIQNDIIFTTLHEAGHCILNKDVMFKKIIWLNIFKEKEITLNQIISKKEQDYLLGKNKIPPLLVYHEMFADTFALLVMKNNNVYKLDKDIEKLISIRLMNEQSIYEPHRSYKAIEDVRKIDSKHIDTYNIYTLTEIIAQKAFIYYLNNE